MKKLWPVLCALLSGALFALALPPYDLEALGAIALAPLLVAVSVPGRRALHACGLGMLAGIAAGVVQIRVGDGVAPERLNFAYLPFIWIGLVFGLVSILAGLARQRWPEDRTRPLLWPLFIACAGVAVEWLTTFSPLPVGIALCQHRNISLIQIASVTGIWGVSFLLWFLNGALASLALERMRIAVAAVAAAGGLLAAAALCGSLVLRQPRAEVRVAAIQDYSAADAGDPNGMRGNGGDTPDIAALMKQAAEDKARLIVGSEEAFGSAFAPDDPDTDVAKLARATKSYFVAGYQKMSNPKDDNCAALVGPDGGTRGVHRKIHLFLGERNAIQAGTTPTVVDSGDPVLGKVGLLICFDTCWTDLTREEAAQGARIIALPNYDPPTPCAVLHHLHTALMPFRAVENRVALVRADPNGLSEIVDPWGRVVAQAPLYRGEAVVGTVPLGGGHGAPFTRLGDWLAYLCAAAVTAALVFSVAFGTYRTSPSA